MKRFEGNNDTMKYMVLLMGDADDTEVVKAAAGAVATLTSYSNKLCKKVYDTSQWEACFLNVLCSQVKPRTSHPTRGTYRDIYRTSILSTAAWWPWGT